MGVEWEWPQWIYAALIVINIVVSAAVHGTPKTGTHNVLWALIASGLAAYILHVGGFW